MACERSPVNRAAGIRVNLKEELPDLWDGQVAAKVRAKLLAELINVQLPTAIPIGFLHGPGRIRLAAWCKGPPGSAPASCQATLWGSRC